MPATPPRKLPRADRRAANKAAWKAARAPAHAVQEALAAISREAAKTGQAHAGNPRPPPGTPDAASLKAHLLHHLAEVGEGGLTHAERLALRLIAVGETGGDKDAVRAIETIADRVDGPVGQGAPGSTTIYHQRILIADPAIRARLEAMVSGALPEEARIIDVGSPHPSPLVTPAAPSEATAGGASGSPEAAPRWNDPSTTAAPSPLAMGPADEPLSTRDGAPRNEPPGTGVGISAVYEVDDEGEVEAVVEPVEG